MYELYDYYCDPLYPSAMVLQNCCAADVVHVHINVYNITLSLWCSHAGVPSRELPRNYIM